MTIQESIFKTLSAIDITDKLKEKNKLKYLPWSSCWAIIKEVYPNATYSPVKTDLGCIYHTDGKTCWVETSLTIKDETQNEILAVMDFRNQSIKAENISSVDVGKSTKRCLVKNAALFGLGLSLWNGEELSDAVKQKRKKKTEEEKESEDKIKTLQTEIVSNAKQMIDSGVDSANIYAKIEQIGGKKNPNSIKDVEKCKKIIEELKKMKENMKNGK